MDAINKCASCFYGGNLKGFRGSVYKFKKAYKKRGDKIIEIDYERGDCGCRMTEWNEQEESCLNHNHNRFVEFEA